VLAGAATAAAVGFPTAAWAAFRGTTADPPSSVAAASLTPPSALGVTFSCALLGVLRPVAHLTWTPTSSPAAGYTLERWSGGTLQASYAIAGASTASYDDGLGAVQLGLGTSYTWHLRSTVGTWVSSDAVVTASSPILCS